MDDASPLVRGAAVWALSQLIEDALDDLSTRMWRSAPRGSSETDAAVRAEWIGLRARTLDFVARDFRIMFAGHDKISPSSPRRGDAFIPNPVSNGPWDPNSMHGRVVIGLLAHVIEAASRRRRIRPGAADGRHVPAAEHP